MKIRFLNTGFPRINLAFLLVISIVIGNVAFNYYIIHRSKTAVTEMTGTITPYVEALSELNLMLTESKMYTTNWVYLQNSLSDKEKLKLIHQKKYRELKKRLEELSKAKNDPEDAALLAQVFSKFNELINVETRIMNTLVDFDDYDNPQKKFECEEIIETEVLPRTHEAIWLLGKLIARNNAEAQAMTASVERNFYRMMTIMLVVSIGMLFFILAAVYYISSGIRRPILRIKEIVYRLSRGQLAYEKLDAKKNVVGEMVNAVNSLSDSFARTSSFANEIGKGNLTVNYEKLSDEDVLGNALINMRNSLRTYSENMEEQVRQRTEEVIEKGRKLENAYHEIRDSINYAKRIQESILPSNAMIEEVFSDSFVFYRPKDVVCGDFYWFGRKENEVVIAAVDCTGHGVPGALMTVIGNSLLNQIITFSGITQPSEILYQLDKKLHDTLKQHGGSVTNDGMDMAICRYVIGEDTITFAGAKRPVYLMRKGQLEEIKGSRAPIGKYVNDLAKDFAEHQITVQKGDTIYMFSDGLQDQFGGPEGKKFMISRFRDMLQAVQGFSLRQQKERIDKELSSWQGDFEQTDDMLLIGIRF